MSLPFPPDSDPPDMIFPVEPPHRRFSPWMILSVCLLTCLSCITVGLSVLVWLNRPGRHATSPDAPGNHWETGEEKRASLRSAFNGQPGQLADRDLNELRQFLAAVAAASKSNNNQSFEMHVDVRRFIGRLLCHPSATKYSRSERRALPASLRGRLEGLGDVDELEIVAITRWPDSADVLIYVWPRSGGTVGDPFRLWLCRSNGQWKLFDWERIEFGLTECERFVVHNAMAKDGGRAAVSAYDALEAALARADTLAAENKQSAAAAQIRQAESQPVPASFHDLCWYLIALRWHGLNEPEDCIRACQQAHQPEVMPGFFVMQASAYQTLNEPDKALAAAARFEKACGVQPDNVRRQAQLYEQLERRDDAREAWRRLVRMQPDDASSLASFSQLLSEDQKGPLAELLLLAKSPLDTAVEVAQRHRYELDEATMRVLVDFIEKQAPGSPRLLAVRAGALELEAEYEQAGEQYLQAARRETDPTRQREFWREYLSAKARAGKAVEGYETHPDPRAALQFLSGGIEEDEAAIDADELPALIEAHRRRVPDDPWLHYFAGHIAREKKDYTEAERELALAEKELPVEDRSQARDLRRQIWCRQRRLLDAYTSFGQDSENYKALAMWCVSERAWDQLRELNDSHRKVHPDDPWLEYYEASLLEREKKPEQALQRLAAVDPSDDASLKYLIRLGKNRLLVDLGRWQAAYQSDEDRTQAFNRLVSQLRQRGELEHLREVCALHRREFPDAPGPLHEEVMSYWEAGDYEQVVNRLTPWPLERQTRLYPLVRLREHLIRSLLRLGRTEEAETRAREAAGRADDGFLSLLVQVARRDVAAVRKLLQNDKLAQRVWGRTLDTDLELAPLFTSSEFTELRREHRVPLPSQSNDEFVVLLLKEPRMPSMDELRHALGLPDAATEGRKLEPSSRSGELWTIIQPQDHSVMFTFGPTPYLPAAELDRLDLHQPDLQQLLADHAGWISVDTVTSPRHATRRGRSPARELAAKLCDANVIGLYYTEADSYTHLLAAAGEDSAQRLASQEKMADAFPDSVTVWLPREEHDPQSDGRKAWGQKGQSVKKLAALLATQPAQRPEVKVRLLRGHAEEEHWLELISGRRTRYANYEFVAELQTPSKLWPHLTPGERYSISNYDLVEWRERP